MSSDRVALNEEIAFQKWEGYAKPIDRGRHVNFGEKFVFATDYVMMSPHFNDGAPQSAAEMFSDEVAAAMAKYAPDGDILTAEWRMWWKHMPDYRLVSPFECVAGEWGFSSCDTYAGHFSRHGVGTAGVGLHLGQRGWQGHALGLVRRP